MATSVGGLVSGLDTQLLIDSVVAREKVAVSLVQKRQAATTATISAFGDLASRLASLRDLARTTADSGVRATKVSSENTAFSAVATGKGSTGQFDIAVESLATTAKTRSVGFASPTAEVRAGRLEIEVKGSSPWQIEIEEGATLPDVVDAIRASGAPVNATIVSDGTNSYLSLANRETGHAVGSAADSALVVRQTLTGSTGTALFGVSPANEWDPLEVRAAAQNAVLHVDGLRMERTSNTIGDAVPGVELTLKKLTPLADDGTRTTESLTFTEDSAKSKERVKAFVDAFNGLVALFAKYRGKPATEAGGERVAGALAGESTVRSLQDELQALLGRIVPGSGARSLAEAGIILQKDGTVLLDDAKYADAMAKDPEALDRVFSASNGVAKALEEITRRYTGAADGYFTTRKDGLNDVVKKLGDDIERMNLHIEKTRDTLTRQFTALEEMISQYNGLNTYLQQQAALAAKNT